jgi:hypothetical protein
MDMTTLEAMARVVILAWSYVNSTPQKGTANQEAIIQVLSWLRDTDNLPVGWEQNEQVSAALDLLD